MKELFALSFKDLPTEIKNEFWNGTKKRLTFKQGTYVYEADWKGAIRAMRERLETPPSNKVKEALEELVSPAKCPKCDGKRLQPESLAVRVGGLGIADYTEMPIEESVENFNKIKLIRVKRKLPGWFCAKSANG